MADSYNADKMSIGFLQVVIAFFVLLLVVYGVAVSYNKLFVENKATESNIEKTVSDNSDKNNTKEDISTYLKGHSFTYNGNGSVRFTGSTMTVTGGRATLEGAYTITSKTTATFAIQAVSGDFDASNNAMCGGKIELNADGTLTETISDGNTTKSYQLLPKK